MAIDRTTDLTIVAEHAEQLRGRLTGQLKSALEEWLQETLANLAIHQEEGLTG
jgi:hypothetical protein